MQILQREIGDYKEIRMLFMTLQDIPRIEREDGPELVSLDQVPTPEIEELGGRVIWAVPVTSFKETMASMMLIAPNYPIVMFLLESDQYRRIDKVEYYRSLSKKEKAYPLASENLPSWRCEYCIPRKQDAFDVVNIFSVIETEKYMNGEDSLRRLFGGCFPMEFEEYMRDKLKTLPKYDIDKAAELYMQAGMGNPVVCRLLVSRSRLRGRAAGPPEKAGHCLEVGSFYTIGITPPSSDRSPPR